MDEFLRELIKSQVVDRNLTAQLCHLRWYFVKGTYVFAMADPKLRREQARYTEICVIAANIFALIADDKDGIEDMFSEAFGPIRRWPDGVPKWPAEAEALMENWLRRWKSWEDADSPIDWARTVAKFIHAGHCPRALDEAPKMSSLEAPTPTGDSYASLIRDVRSDQLAREINTTVDLQNACEKERLRSESRELAMAQYDGVPFSAAAEVLGMPEHAVAAARRGLKSAKPALQARLEPYRHGRTTSGVKEV